MLVAVCLRCAKRTLRAVAFLTTKNTKNYIEVLFFNFVPLVVSETRLGSLFGQQGLDLFEGFSIGTTDHLDHLLAFVFFCGGGCNIGFDA